MSHPIRFTKKKKKLFVITTCPIHLKDLTNFRVCQNNISKIGHILFPRVRAPSDVTNRTKHSLPFGQSPNLRKIGGGTEVTQNFKSYT